MAIFRYCKIIGIDTIADLERFYKTESYKGESLVSCMKRYIETELKQDAQ